MTGTGSTIGAGIDSGVSQLLSMNIMRIAISSVRIRAGLALDGPGYSARNKILVIVFLYFFKKNCVMNFETCQRRMMI